MGNDIQENARRLLQFLDKNQKNLELRAECVKDDRRANEIRLKAAKIRDMMWEVEHKYLIPKMY